ncbi:MAG: fibronectin type III domain-containing protein [Gemmatimonadota bacterium]
MRWTRLLALLIAGSVALAGCDDDGNGTGPEIDPPAAPTNLEVTVSGTDATVSWDAVSNATSYRVEVKTTGEADRAQTTSDTQVTFDGLSEGATYSAQVFALNDEGEAASAVHPFAVDETVVLVAGDIVENTTWTADRTWVLTQPVFVGRDCGPDGTKDGCEAVTLTIEPGTTILGKSDVPQGVRGAYLVVSRGSRLVADATGGEDRKPTADEVIVFTSDKPRGQRAVEDWGGIVINGRAPTNAGDEAQGEGDSGFYGGTDVDDDSGILRGVRIEFAGDDVTPADQLNGLALQGVGAGTTISYLQIHYNKDDGIEPFGGTVSVDHLVVTGIGDDSVDGTDGYRGFMQFIIGQQRGADADNGLEISNNGDDGAATPKSTAVIANATLIGARDARVGGGIGGAESDDAIQLREGSNYRVFNSIFTGFGNSGLCIRDAQTIVNANDRLAGETDPDRTLRAEGLILWNNGGDTEAANFNACGGGSSAALNQQFFETAGFNNVVADPGLPGSAFEVGSMSSPPDVIPAAMPASYTGADLTGIDFDDHLVAPVDGRTLVPTDYAGAVAPGTALADAWYTGWTVWTADGADSRPNTSN